MRRLTYFSEGIQSLLTSAPTRFMEGHHDLLAAHHGIYCIETPTLTIVSHVEWNRAARPRLEHYSRAETAFVIGV